MGNDLNIDLGLSINGPGSFDESVSDAKVVQGLMDEVNDFINKVAKMSGDVSVNITKVVKDIESSGDHGGLIGGLIGGLLGGVPGAIIGNKIGSHEGAELANFVRSHEAEVEKSIASLIQKSKECLVGMFSPFVIQTVAGRWGDTLYKMAGDAANMVEHKKADLIDLTGQFASAYDEVLGSQTKACEVVREMCKSMQERLGAMAGSCWKFMTETVKSLVQALEPVLEAVADLATVIGVKDAIEKLGKLVGKVLEFLATLYSEVGDFARECQAFIQATERDMNSQIGLKNMEWPTPLKVLGPQ